MKASRLDAEDPVHRLLKDAQRALEREQARIARERELAAEEARRQATKQPEAEAPGSDAGTGQPAGQGEDEEIQWE